MGARYDGDMVGLCSLLYLSGLVLLLGFLRKTGVSTVSRDEDVGAATLRNVEKCLIGC